MILLKNSFLVVMIMVLLGCIERRDPDTLPDSYDAYIENHRDQAASFMYNAISDKGLPVILVKLFPVVFPELFGTDAEGMARFGFFPDETKALPVGHGVGQSPPLVSWLGPLSPSLSITTLACGGCHSAEVKVDGKKLRLIGAPNGQLDLRAFQVAISKAANTEKWVAKTFTKALDGKPYGWLKTGWIQEMVDRQIFKSKADAMLAGVKKTAGKMDGSLLKYLAPIYGDQSLIDQAGPGRVDVFGNGIAYYLMDHEQAEIANNPQFLPSHVGLVDFMHVWYQDERPLAQWDGSIRGDIARNLATIKAILRVDHETISNRSIEMVVDMTKFISKLPAPAYPLPIDQAKAQSGKPLFDQLCKDCHGKNQRLVNYDLLETDPNRGKAFNTVKANFIAKDIIKICERFSLSQCVKESEVVATEGYLATSLRGVWSTAPYLHNGSVPNLRSFFKKAEDRPKTFYRGSNELDSANMGFVSDKGPFLFDVKLSGNSNEGHDSNEFFGDLLDHPADVEAIIEYLKTL